MPNFVSLRHCVQDKMQVSENFTDKPRKYFRYSLYSVGTLFQARGQGWGGLRQYEFESKM